MNKLKPNAEQHAVNHDPDGRVKPHNSLLLKMMKVAVSEQREERH